MSQRVCRCEATIAASILEDYACGRPDCFRTAEVQASFDAFVAELIRKRGEEQPAPPAPSESD